MTEDLIAEKYNICKQSVRRIWERNGILARPRPRYKCNPTIKCDDSYFEDINNPERAWVLGFVAGDGSITSGHTLEIGLSIKDLTLLEKISKFLKSDHKLVYGNHYMKKYDKSYPFCRLRIDRSKYYDDLIKWGIGPNKSHVLSIPKIEEWLVPHFIRGMICSDGCFSIDETNTIIFSLACPVYSFLEEVQRILMKNCELAEIKIRKIDENNKAYVLRYGGNYQVRKIFEYLYQDNMGNAYLERKYNYCKKHFYNLDNGIRSREPFTESLDQYSWGNSIGEVTIKKVSELTSKKTASIPFVHELQNETPTN